MKNKKSALGIITGIIIGLIILSGIGTGVYYLITKPAPQIIVTTPGCQFIENPDDPNSIYTEVLDFPRFTCEADECIVSGVMDVDKGIGIDVWTRSRRLGCSINFNTEAECLSKINKCNVINSVGECSVGSGICHGQTCRKSSSTIYEADFNFCPDPNFPFCTGTKNTVKSQGFQYTDEYKLNRGGTVTFEPKNDDGSDVTTKFIRVKSYDCSCLPAVNDGTACGTGQLMCKPFVQTFRRNHVNTAEQDCEDSGCSNCIYEGRIRGGICDSYYPNCHQYKCEDYIKYQKCDSTQQIGQATCNDWGTEGTCPTGQQCFVDATGEVGEGVGGCRCPADPCILGEKRAIGTNIYQECTTVGNCLDWSSDKYCLQDLVFDPITGDCVCDPAFSCNPTEAECIGNQIRKCEPNFIGGKTCYQWGDTELCSGELNCWNRNNLILDDVCSCESVDSCELGTIDCTSSTTYDVCTKDSTNPSDSCLMMRDLGNTVGAFEECRNNEIIRRADIGCAYGTPGFECDTINFEVCVDNTCLCLQDGNTATSTDYINLQTRCSNNLVQDIKKYENCYRWETKEECTGDFTCVETSGQASCKPGFQFVGIILEDTYGINQLINNVKIIATNEIPGGNVNMIVVARLIEGTSILKQVNTITDSNGEAIIDFNYAHPRVGDLSIEVSIEPTGRNFQQTKIIKIEQTLEVKLLCPPQGFVGRSVICSWQIEDVNTGLGIFATPKIRVIQGVNDLIYTPIGTSSVEFMSYTIGSVNVEVSAEKQGYIPDTSTATVQIQQTTIDQIFNIDNQDFFTYAGLGVSTGTHQLESIIKESGQPVDVQRIDAIIETPSGQIVPIGFNKVSEGVYKTTYNFQQSATTYFLSGTIYFTDITKSPAPFNYAIVTLAGTTAKQKSNINLLIIGIGVAVFVILALVIIFLLRRRR